MLRSLTRLYMAGVAIGAPLTLVLAPAWPPRWVWLALQVIASLLLASVALVMALRWVRPPITPFMLYYGLWRNRGRDHGPFEYQWVSEAGLPMHLRLAAIASEDTYFAFHAGFDWDSLRAARDYNRQTGERRGASTITQQLARNLFLWPAKSYLRKAAEAYFTLLIEAAWPKRRILEMYLNVAQFGHRTFGAEAAARRYFGKSAQALTAAEAALLVAVLPAPNTTRPDQPSRLVRYRQLMILGSMKKLRAAYLPRLGAQPDALSPETVRS